MAYLIGSIVGLCFVSFILTGLVYLIMRLFRRKLTRAQFWSVFGTTFIILLVLNIVGRFAS